MKSVKNKGDIRSAKQYEATHKSKANPTGKVDTSKWTKPEQKKLDTSKWVKPKPKPPPAPKTKPKTVQKPPPAPTKSIKGNHYKGDDHASDSTTMNGPQRGLPPVPTTKKAITTTTGTTAKPVPSNTKRRPLPRQLTPALQRLPNRHHNDYYDSQASNPVPSATKKTTTATKEL
eukprot:871213_1